MNTNQEKKDLNLGISDKEYCQWLYQEEMNDGYHVYDLELENEEIKNDY